MMGMGMLVRLLRVGSFSRRRLSAAMAGALGMLGYILVISKDTRICVSGMVCCESNFLRWRESWIWWRVFMVEGVMMLARNLEVGWVMESTPDTMGRKGYWPWSSRGL